MSTKSVFDHNHDKEHLSLPERIGEAFALIGLLFLLGFFVYHQSADTGFFTHKFGTLEMLCIYVPLLSGFLAPSVRLWLGRRNPGRLFEAMTALLLSMGALWLLIIFPLDYAHLADALPSFLQPLLSWVTDDIARIVLALQVIAGPLAAVANIWHYLAYRMDVPVVSSKQQFA